MARRDQQQPMIFPRVVHEYTDVFPAELAGLPPQREIEFRIDILPSASPIALPMYRMAPVERDELQRQLAELMRLGFIRRSISPGLYLRCSLRRKTTLFDST